MWSAAMESAIESTKNMSDPEKAKLIEHISQEFVRVDLKFKEVQQRFQCMLNGQGAPTRDN